MSIIAAFKQSSNNPRVASRIKLVASVDNLAPVSRQSFHDFSELIILEEFHKDTKAYRDFMLNLTRLKVYTN